MTTPAKPKVVHVYRAKDDSIWLWGNEEPAHFAGSPEYLGEYAPRGPVVRESWEIRWQDAQGDWNALGRFDDEADAMSDAEEHFGTGNDYKYRIVHITTRKVCR